VNCKYFFLGGRKVDRKHYPWDGEVDTWRPLNSAATPSGGIISLALGGFVPFANAFSRSRRIAALLALTALTTAFAQEISRNTPPGLIYKVAPEYTQQALDARNEGVVLLHATVNQDGAASDITIVRGLGPGLDEKAVECLKQWRFKPAARDGEPTSGEAMVEIHFRLPRK
jgi:TonB family protein